MPITVKSDVSSALTAPPTIRPTSAPATTSGMNSPPTPPPATVVDGRDAPEHEDRGDEPDAVRRVERPADGVVARSGREVLLRRGAGR